jgi:hypothetical protein
MDRSDAFEPVHRESAHRLALVWAGNPEWTDTNLSVADTKPGDSSINVGWSDDKAARSMPVSADQARQIAMELIIRADIIDPQAGA